MALKDFQFEYDRLNDRQKEAVDTIYGPILVIAGPGTGKTQLLSLRVANILLKTDINEDNILCLTFSESGAQAMRDRLLKLIGPNSNRITVNTYHGFSNDIILNNPESNNPYIGYRPIGSLRAKKIIASIQAELDYSNNLKNSYYLDAIKSLISDAKKAGITSSMMAKIGQENISSIKTTETFLAKISPNIARIKKSVVPDFLKISLEFKKTQKTLQLNDKSLLGLVNEELDKALLYFDETAKTNQLTSWKSKYLDKNSNDNYILKSPDINNKLLDLAVIYELYEKELNNKKLYDYDDMILNAIELLSSNPKLKYSIQEKYQFMLIDEFQDSNDSQVNLINILSDNPINDRKPNVMIVGDDDQAIYAFQGARYSHMLNFLKTYKEVKVVILAKNYRSSEHIINFADNLANQIETRLTDELPGVSKTFKINSSLQNDASSLERIQFNTELAQISWLKEELKNNYLNSKKTIAIIATKHRDLKLLAADLMQDQIPFNYDLYENIIETKEFNEIFLIAKAILAIKALDNASIDYYLSKISAFDFLNIDELKLWEISLKAHTQKLNWLDLWLADPDLKMFSKFLIKLSLSLELYNFDQILDYILGIATLNLAEDKIYRSNFMSYNRNLDPSGYKLLEIFSNLNYLKKQFLEYSLDNSSENNNLQAFIDFIEDIKSTEEKITNVIKYQDISNIHLMTAFKAKGQEFEDVILINFSDRYWGHKLEFRSNKITLPSNLDYIKSADAISDDQKLRLLYVASTRARKKLIFSGFDLDIDGKETAPVSFLQEDLDDKVLDSPLLGTKYSKIKLLTSNEPKIETFLNIRKGELTYFKGNTKLHSLIRERIDNYQLSPTGLNDFIDIISKGPEYFYIKHILKYPSLKTNYISYGNAIHASLEWLQNNLSKTKKLSTLNELVSIYENNLKLQVIANNEFKFYLKKGQKALTNYYKTHQYNLSPIDIAELNFKDLDLSINGSKITGKIDKIIIEPDSRSLQIVDYKSSRFSNLTKASNKHQGYIRQLYFYKILLGSSDQFKKYSISKARIEYIDDIINPKSYVEVSLEESKLNEIESLITAVSNQIKNFNIIDTASYSKSTSGVNKFIKDLVEGKHN